MRTSERFLQDMVEYFIHELSDMTKSSRSYWRQKGIRAAREAEEARKGEVKKPVAPVMASCQQCGRWRCRDMMTLYGALDMYSCPRFVEERTDG